MSDAPNENPPRFNAFEITIIILLIIIVIAIIFSLLLPFDGTGIQSNVIGSL